MQTIADAELLSTEYLQPTSMIDSHHPAVLAYLTDILNGKKLSDKEAAITLYKRVRDDIKYNPYVAFHLEDTYRASTVLERKKGYCVGKASLLCALARAHGIPARIGFATVRNHIATKQLIKLLGTNEFIYHGYTEMYLDGKWVSATPAFDQKTCERHKVQPLEFNGEEDSKFQMFNQGDGKFLEILENLGSYADIPLQKMEIAYREKYGNELADKWIAAFDSLRSIAKRKFENEDIIQ